MLQSFDFEVVDNGLNTVDDPSKSSSCQTSTASTSKGFIEPRRGFPVSAITENIIGMSDKNKNSGLQNKYHMILSDSVGFIRKAISKIIILR